MEIQPVSDEVKTLITVLKGQIFLLGKDWDNLLGPEMKELAQSAVKTVSELNDLVRGDPHDRRDGSRPEGSQVAPSEPHRLEWPKDVSRDEVSSHELVAPVPADELVVALQSSESLELMGISNDDLMRGLEGLGLRETLTIALDVLAALDEEGVLGIFVGLPTERQANFLRWIASTGGPELRRTRTATFVSALLESPLTPTTEPSRSR